MGCKHGHCFLLLTDVGEALTERLMWLSFHCIGEAGMGVGRGAPLGLSTQRTFVWGPLVRGGCNPAVAVLPGKALFAPRNLSLWHMPQGQISSIILSILFHCLIILVL